METDPRGQLGGLETSDAVRKRHATASHAFKCPTCAKTNFEIIQECEEAAKANADPNSTAEVEIPSELKLGYKDEMSKAVEGPEGAQTATTTAAAAVERPEVPTPRTGAVDTESAELAEGFIPFGDDIVSSCSPRTGSSRPYKDSLVAPGPNVSVRQQAPPVARAYDEGVPLWIDRAIVVLVVLLLAMILKVLLDL
ncbi:ubiquitin-conjugating enzyme [Colletotrichum higginsianum]|nr:ubiquitin-conjugating enzyme [Colletotrichum higginsianum]